MKKALIIIGVLGTSYTANVHCMEEAFKFTDNENPPAYFEPQASAPQHDVINRHPQGNDVYMTYQEWWERNNVPRDVRNKSVREQAEWVVERNAARQQEEENKTGCSGFLGGVCAACCIMKVLAGIP